MKSKISYSKFQKQANRWSHSGKKEGKRSFKNPWGGRIVLYKGIGTNLITNKQERGWWH